MTQPNDGCHAADESPAVAATRRARAMLARRLGNQLPALQQLRAQKRICEFAIFITLWLGGIALILAAGRWPAGIHGAAVIAGTGCIVIALNAFVLLLHEGMHGTLWLTPRWNRAISVLLGPAVLMSFTAYQVMHTRHHDYLGNPCDPDDYYNYTRRRGVVWALHFVRLLIGTPLYLFLIPVLAWKYGSREQRCRILAEYALLFVLWGAVGFAVPWPVLWQAWCLPLLCVGLLVSLRGLAQHGITDAHDPFLASRTMVPHPVVEFCLLGENYHLAHHFFPEVPSYHLRRLHGLLRPHLPRAVVGTSYIGFLFAFLAAVPRLDETPIGLSESLDAKSA